MRLLRQRAPLTPATLAERERALGLDIAAAPPEPSTPTPPAPVREDVPAALPPAPPPAPEPAATEARIADRLTERTALVDALLTWGEAHDWPRVPLASTARGPFVWLMAGEEHWYTFVGNAIETLRHAGAAISEMARSEGQCTLGQ